MDERPFETEIGDDAAESLVSATRTSLGDTLRSVVYFTPSAFDVLYVRSDLSDSRRRVRTAVSRLVEIERIGFAERPVRSAIAESDRGGTIGRYAFTVRFHEDGFVVRVLQGDAGVLLTADSMDVDAFEDAAAAVRRVLADA
jgi:hypothetical protein